MNPRSDIVIMCVPERTSWGWLTATSMRTTRLGTRMRLRGNPTSCASPVSAQVAVILGEKLKLTFHILYGFLFECICVWLWVRAYMCLCTCVSTYECVCVFWRVCVFLSPQRPGADPGAYPAYGLSEGVGWAVRCGRSGQGEVGDWCKRNTLCKHSQLWFSHFYFIAPFQTFPMSLWGYICCLFCDVCVCLFVCVCLEHLDTGRFQRRRSLCHQVENEGHQDPLWRQLSLADSRWCGHHSQHSQWSHIRQVNWLDNKQGTDNTPTTSNFISTVNWPVSKIHNNLILAVTERCID